METVGTWWMWTGFAAIVAAMLVIDLFVVGGGKQRRVSFKEAACPFSSPLRCGGI